MRLFFTSLPGNIIGCFKCRMILWHVVAIALTVLLVTTGMDWQYYLATRGLRAWAFPAVHLGGLLPLLLPLILLIYGVVAASTPIITTGFAIGQAELLGSLISSTYKAFTGRAHPPHVSDTDMTHIFKFGFLRGGVFWGWPSSHATIAFAMALTVCALFPKRRWLGIAAILYAFYIGIGVSMTIHWLSDFVAGAIIGSVIGTVVGKCFRDADGTSPQGAQSGFT